MSLDQLIIAKNSLNRVLADRLKDQLAELDSVAGRPRAHPAKGIKVAPKYRDPVTGATWSGRGMMPRWMRDGMKKSKKKPEDFLIKRGRGN
jgi:DNA-binding protein H-NS